MTYRVKSGDSLSKIAREHDLSFNELLALNPRFKANPNLINVGDEIVVTPQETPSEPAPVPPVEPPASTGSADYFEVSMGQLTFDAEGMEVEGPYFSRRPHVPGAWSGVTIGRGYDMKERSADEILTDLTTAGVPADVASKFSACGGLMGSHAEEFLVQNDYDALLISPEQQKRLFLLTYQELEGDVLRICNKADVVAKYGSTAWATLNPYIRDIVVDLRYRGDYTPSTRQKVQPVLVNNNLTEMKQLMGDREYWVRQRRVPLDRFKRRKNYLANA